MRAPRRYIIYIFNACVYILYTYSAPTTTAVKAYLTPINHVTGLFCIIYFIMGHCLRAVVSYVFVRVCVCVCVVAVVRRLYDDGDRTGTTRTFVARFGIYSISPTPSPPHLIVVAVIPQKYIRLYIMNSNAYHYTCKI